MAIKSSKTEMFENLRVMLRDVFRLRSQGVAYARLARAHGYVDGYTRVLLESGIADQKELLELLSEERTRIDGPATRRLSAEDAAAAPQTT